jgi:predicted TIM-barrel fold metal-dependent hydrolase
LANDPSNKIAGVIASCRPEADALRFDAWLDELQDSRVMGFRRILHVEPDELSASDIFINNVRKLGNRDMTFDMCFLERQLPVAIRLAQNCDNTQLILNHCGIPDIAAGDFQHWENNIIQLAKLPNVACKVSGVIAYCPTEQATAETIRPYIEHCIEAFGGERIVWGGDWPVCNLTSDLSSWASIFRSLVSMESEDTQRKMCMDNAIQIYNLPI